MEINPQDITIETYNTSDSGWVSNRAGIRLTHVPTKVIVSYGESRSVHSNRAKAFDLLLGALENGTDLTKQLELEF